MQLVSFERGATLREKELMKAPSRESCWKADIPNIEAYLRNRSKCCFSDDCQARVAAKKMFKSAYEIGDEINDQTFFVSYKTEDGSLTKAGGTIAIGDVAADCGGTG